MAIAVVDTYTEEFTNSTGFTTADGVAVSGSNTLLFVAWLGAGSDPGDLTVVRDPGGEDSALTEIRTDSSGSQAVSSIWYEIAPTAGTDLIAFDWSNASPKTGGIALYALSGVHQTTPISSNNGGGGFSGDPTVSISPGSTDLCIDAAASSQDGLTADGTQTPVLDTDVTNAAVGSSYRAGSGTSMDWTADPGDDRWCASAAVIAEAAAGGGGLGIPIAMHHYKQIMGVN